MKIDRLNKDDILTGLVDTITTQSYQKKTLIDGVEIREFRQFSAEDGTFAELMRLNEDGTMQIFPEFKLLQINRSSLLPGAIKAWHLHFNQEDIWYVPPQAHMLLGLWDLRKESPTADMKLKLPLGAGHNKLILIPRGVAHGVANIASEPGDLFYFINQIFDPENPDENRLPWNAAGDDFWVPERA